MFNQSKRFKFIFFVIKFIILQCYCTSAGHIWCVCVPPDAVQMRLHCD